MKLINKKFTLTVFLATLTLLTFAVAGYGSEQGSKASTRVIAASDAKVKNPVKGDTRR